MTIHEGRFGSCCGDLDDVMTKPPNPLFRVEEDGVLRLTVGYAQTEQGVGWFDHAVLFCPFCGAQIQDREDIRRRSPASG